MFRSFLGLWAHAQVAASATPRSMFCPDAPQLSKTLDGGCASSAAAHSVPEVEALEPAALDDTADTPAVADMPAANPPQAVEPPPIPPVHKYVRKSRS